MDASTGPTSPLPDRLRALSERIGREYDCRLVVLFGSTARGERSPGDLDIGVLCAGEADVIELTNRLTRELGVQDVDVCDLRRADPLLLMLAARDGEPLYEGRAGEFARFASLAARRYADTRKFREMERREIHEFLERAGERA